MCAIREAYEASNSKPISELPAEPRLPSEVQGPGARAARNTSRAASPIASAQHPWQLDVRGSQKMRVMMVKTEAKRCD